MRWSYGCIWDKSDRYRKWMGSVLLLGLYGDVLDQHGFDEVAIHDLFHHWCVARKLQHWWLWVHHKVELSLRITATDVSWVHLQKSSLTVVQLHLGLSLHEGLSGPVFSDPLAVGVTDAQTKMDDVGWIRQDLQLRIFSPLRLVRLTEMLIFLSLKIVQGSSSCSYSLYWYFFLPKRWPISGFVEVSSLSWQD